MTELILSMPELITKLQPADLTSNLPGFRIHHWHSMGPSVKYRKENQSALNAAIMPITITVASSRVTELRGATVPAKVMK